MRLPIRRISHDSRLRKNWETLALMLLVCCALMGMWLERSAQADLHDTDIEQLP